VRSGSGTRRSAARRWTWRAGWPAHPPARRPGSDGALCGSSPAAELPRGSRAEAPGQSGPAARGAIAISMTERASCGLASHRRVVAPSLEVGVRLLLHLEPDPRGGGPGGGSSSRQTIPAEQSAHGCSGETANPQALATARLRATRSS